MVVCAGCAQGTCHGLELLSLPGGERAVGHVAPRAQRKLGKQLQTGISRVGDHGLQPLASNATTYGSRSVDGAGGSSLAVFGTYRRDQ